MNVKTVRSPKKKMRKADIWSLPYFLGKKQIVCKNQQSLF